MAGLKSGGQDGPVAVPASGRRRLALRAGRSRRGINTVEAALLLPVVLMVTFGTIEYGWMFLKSHQITNAARQAARFAALPDSDTATTKSRLISMAADAGITINAGQITTTPAEVKGVSAGTLVKVSVTVPYADSNLSLTNMGKLLPLPTNLSADVTMAKEGP